MSRLASLFTALLGWILGLFRPSHADSLTTPPAAPSTSKISPAVRQFVLTGHTQKEQADLEAQIDQAERNGLRSFTLNYPGGYYRIVDGQIIESGRYT